MLSVLLGIAELACGYAAFGVLTQLAAIGLIVIMLDAMHTRKIFLWHTGFWLRRSSGWHYDLTSIVMNFVILFSDGGRWVLWR